MTGRAPILCSCCSAAPATVRRWRLCMCASCAGRVAAEMMGGARHGYDDRRVDLSDEGLGLVTRGAA